MLDLSWIVHLLGALATAHFASTVFSGRARNPQALGLAAGVVALVALLGAGWVVHPAAGMLLAFLVGWMDGGTRRWQNSLPMLGVALLSAAAFLFLGAGWLIFPLVVVLAITAFSALNRSSARMGQASGDASAPASGALPEQAGGLPMPGVPTPQGEAIPVRPAGASVPQAQNVAASLPTDLQGLHRDTRLPAEARALLVALDLRTAEAMRALSSQGQTGTQAAYQVRAIREEYVPAAVQAYLKLPPTRADVTPIDDGKTGKDLLIEQLNLLLNAAQDLLEACAQAGGQELLSHGRFLREKFGFSTEKDKDLKV